jgi:hypothetical protein
MHLIGFDDRKQIRDKAIDLYLKKRELAKTDCEKFNL